jgi:hypothetical protein
MTDKPGIWKRVLAYAGNEVNAELLEAYRRAGSGIHDQLEEASRKRFDLKLEGKNVWTSDRGSQLALLCTWNAHALQTLGDQMLDADYKAYPATSGFVPRVTAEQAQGFYDQVESWLSRARQASINPNYQIDVALPATLPKWSEVEPCPRPHLDAMMAAVKHIQLHADAAFAGLELDNTPDDHKNTLSFLRQKHAEARTKAEYVQNLWQPNASLELHERIEEQAKIAVELYYDLGQCLAMPELAARELERRTKKSSGPGKSGSGKKPAGTWRFPPMPGQADFDPWVMTDPESVATLKKDNKARVVMEEMWRYNPEPRKTLEVFMEIEAARERGDIDYALDARGKRIGHYFCTPWAPIYVVKRPLTIFGERLNTMQQFTLEAAAEGVLIGEEFKLEIVTGTFRSAELDYCDPRKPSPHD